MHKQRPAGGHGWGRAAGRGLHIRPPAPRALLRFGVCGLSLSLLEQLYVFVTLRRFSGARDQLQCLVGPHQPLRSRFLEHLLPLLRVAT